jgi:oligopeptide transport system permease protein
MRTYILKRLLWAIPTIVAISLLTFIVMRLTPGGPFQKLRQSDRPIPDTVFETLNAKYGLDKPWLVQYGNYMWNALHGDLGPSYDTGVPVSQMISEGLGVSATLGGLALLVGVIAGGILGIIAALYRNTIVDHVVVFISMIGVSVPAFVLALYAITLLAVRLRWVPTGGWGTPKQAILPVLVLSLGPAATVARYLRSSILEIVGQDYVRTARAKGLSPTGVLTVHVLRNSLISVTTVVGLTVPNILTGSFIIESMFRIPGVGGMWVYAVGNRDYPVMMGQTLMYVVILIAATLLTDIAYAAVDPRIRLGE